MRRGRCAELVLGTAAVKEIEMIYLNTAKLIIKTARSQACV